MVNDGAPEILNKRGNTVTVMTGPQSSRTLTQQQPSAPMVNLNFTFAPGITTSDQAAVQGFVRTVVIPELSRAVSSGIKR